jgi:hypothetical protein
MNHFAKKIILGSLMSLSLNVANAGIGLSSNAISNLAKGEVLAAAIGGGLGAASIIHGVNLVEKGKVGWGVFFLVLEENDVINSKDFEFLSNLDISEKEALAEIIKSDESEEAKKDMLKALFE